MKTIKIAILLLCAVPGMYAGNTYKIGIVMGSTRQGRSSDKIAREISTCLSRRSDIVCEILDIKEFQIPFFEDEVAPARRDKIKDAQVQRWSGAVARQQAFIFIVPEYNAGYPGVLKNALDSLYKEWNNKPAALIGYSGGESGGVQALAQFREVVKAFKMMPLEDQITIPSSWKAFDHKGALMHASFAQELTALVDQLIKNI